MKKLIKGKAIKGMVIVLIQIFLMQGDFAFGLAPWLGATAGGGTHFGDLQKDLEKYNEFMGPIIGTDNRASKGIVESGKKRKSLSKEEKLNIVKKNLDFFADKKDWNGKQKRSKLARDMGFWHFGDFVCMLNDAKLSDKHETIKKILANFDSSNIERLNPTAKQFKNISREVFYDIVLYACEEQQNSEEVLNALVKGDIVNILNYNKANETINSNLFKNLLTKFLFREIVELKLDEKIEVRDFYDIVLSACAEQGPKEVVRSLSEDRIVEILFYSVNEEAIKKINLLQESELKTELNLLKIFYNEVYVKYKNKKDFLNKKEVKQSYQKLAKLLQKNGLPYVGLGLILKAILEKQVGSRMEKGKENGKEKPKVQTMAFFSQGLGLTIDTSPGGRFRKVSKTVVTPRGTDRNTFFGFGGSKTPGRKIGRATIVSKNMGNKKSKTEEDFFEVVKGFYSSVFDNLDRKIFLLQLSENSANSKNDAAEVLNFKCARLKVMYDFVIEKEKEGKFNKQLCDSIKGAYRTTVYLRLKNNKDLTGIRKKVLKEIKKSKSYGEIFDLTSQIYNECKKLGIEGRIMANLIGGISGKPNEKFYLDFAKQNYDVIYDNYMKMDRFDLKKANWRVLVLGRDIVQAIVDRYPVCYLSGLVDDVEIKIGKDNGRPEINGGKRKKTKRKSKRYQYDLIKLYRNLVNMNFLVLKKDLLNKSETKDFIVKKNPLKLYGDAVKRKIGMVDLDNIDKIKKILKDELKKIFKNKNYKDYKFCEARLKNLIEVCDNGETWLESEKKKLDCLYRDINEGQSHESPLKRAYLFLIMNNFPALKSCIQKIKQDLFEGANDYEVTIDADKVKKVQGALLEGLNSLTGKYFKEKSYFYNIKNNLSHLIKQYTNNVWLSELREKSENLSKSKELGDDPYKKEKRYQSREKRDGAIFKVFCEGLYEQDKDGFIKAVRELKDISDVKEFYDRLDPVMRKILINRVREYSENINNYIDYYSNKYVLSLEKEYIKLKNTKDSVIKFEELMKVLIENNGGRLHEENCELGNIYTRISVWKTGLRYAMEDLQVVELEEEELEEEDEGEEVEEENPAIGAVAEEEIDGDDFDSDTLGYETAGEELEEEELKDEDVFEGFLADPGLKDHQEELKEFFNNINTTYEITEVVKDVQLPEIEKQDLFGRNRVILRIIETDELKVIVPDTGKGFYAHLRDGYLYVTRKAYTLFPDLIEFHELGHRKYSRRFGPDSEKFAEQYADLIDLLDEVYKAETEQIQVPENYRGRKVSETWEKFKGLLQSSYDPESRLQKKKFVLNGKSTDVDINRYIVDGKLIKLIALKNQLHKDSKIKITGSSNVEEYIKKNYPQLEDFFNYYFDFKSDSVMGITLDELSRDGVMDRFNNMFSDEIEVSS